MTTSPAFTRSLARRRLPSWRNAQDFTTSWARVRERRGMRCWMKRSSRCPACSGATGKVSRIPLGSQPGGSGTRGRLRGLDNLTRADAARACHHPLDPAVYDCLNRLQVRLLPLPGLDVRVAHFVSLVAVLAAEIACLCHGRSSAPKGPRLSTGSAEPQICCVASICDQRYNQ